MVRLGSINIAFWLCHEDSFMEITIQKGIIDINMLNGPVVINSQGENDLNSRGFNHWREGIEVVNAWNLLKSHGYQASLVAIQGAISIILDTKNPLVDNRLI